MKQCENCGIEHDGTYGSGRFCSGKCVKSFGAKINREERNNKIRKPIIEIEKICLECSSTYKTNIKNNRKFCSRSCSSIYNNRLNKELVSEKLKLYYLNNPDAKQVLLNNASKGGKTHKGKPLSEEHKRKLSISSEGRLPFTDEHKRKISLNNKGGRCKWYEFIKNDGTIIKVQGTYELRFAKILNEIDENWIKPSIHDRKHQFNWIGEDGKSHWYTPDFWSPKLNKYFELKGFWTKNQLHKKKFIETLDNINILYIENLNKLENENYKDYRILGKY